MIEDPPEPVTFSEQYTGCLGSSSNFSKQDSRSTGSNKTLVSRIHWMFRQLLTQDPGSVKIPDIGSYTRYQMRILDPGYFLDLGTSLVGTQVASIFGQLFVSFWIRAAGLKTRERCDHSNPLRDTYRAGMTRSGMPT